ncbi:centrosomal protein of 104 kDa [Polypterus senegalus]|uniref:centrosomal protein of 104 kDa n=1 Tax=Polypterus senegalus TaxID=55291 RepID=UPI001964AB0F|nr:centrosomal protein of 104 kDa [Polypterus senegalus]
MPHKVGFIVISSSGHEDGYSAKELMVHAPTVSGWRSASSGTSHPDKGLELEKLSFDEKKQEAVEMERYDLAKKLKQAIADLQKVGERLGRYEVEKRCAVEKEDYDLAKQKKHQMDEYRMKVYQQLKLHNLLDTTVIRRPSDFLPEPLSYPSPQPQSSEQPTPVQYKPEGKWSNILSLSQRLPPATPVKPVVPKINVNSLPYDERPLPALQKQMGEQQSFPSEPSPPDSDRTARGTGITGQFPNCVYGEGLVAGAYSKTWSYREDALLAVYKKLMDVPMGTSKEDLKTMIRAAIFLVRKGLLDKVSSSSFLPWTHTGLQCVEMALFKEVKVLQVIPTELVKPLKTTMPARLALSQMELLERLLKDLGTDNSGFTVDNVMQCATGALEHSASEVRDSAVRLILSMYHKHKSTVLTYLPSEDANTRKNILYKTLFDGFAKIDGRPTEAQTKLQRKTATQAAEKKKKEEILALQEQLAALKEIQAEVQSGKDKERDMLTAGKAGGKKAPSAIADSGDDHSSVVNYLDNLCIFCGERDDSFTEEGLDLHYWKHCPMLKRCEHCRQVVEISSLTDHLLTECDKKDSFGKCQRCTEAIPKEELIEHIRAKTCNPAKSEKVANYCPLCHENFSPGEEAWKSHLMGRDGCKMNPRRIQALQRTQSIQGKTNNLAVTKPGVSGVKGRSPSSKIPAPRAGVGKTINRTSAKP